MTEKTKENTRENIYKYHFFFCTNQKKDNKKCCQEIEADKFSEYTKDKLIELDSHGAGKIRVSKSGCLGQCSKGPNLVVYPDNKWYNYSSKEDLDQIIDKYIRLIGN